jgi:spore coat protein CotH
LNPEDLPDPEEINQHIAGMLDGKIGQLAREIAEETANELNMDLGETSDMKDIFQNMLKNPTKLMGLVKTVGNKLDAKIKSGELKESEMIQEATEIMNKMKNMPGMGNIQSMLNKMGMGGMGKMNTGAMEAQMNRNLKTAQMKERIRAKAQANALKRQMEQQMQSQAQTVTSASSSVSTVVSDEELMKLFSKEERAERTPREAGKKKKGKK